MSVSRKHLFVVLLLGVVAYGAYYFSSNSPQPTQQAEARTVGPERKFKTFSDKPIILPKGRTLQSYSDEELLALVDAFAGKQQENKEHTISTKEYVVESGDTIVTDGYETAPGVFVLSTMKLNVAGNSSEPKVAFNLSRAKLSLGGEYSPLVEDSDEIDSGRGYRANNDRYSLYFKAAVLPNGKQIKVSMKETEYEKSRVQVSP